MFGNNFGLGLVLTLTDNATAGLSAFVGVLGSTQNKVNSLSPALQGLSNSFNALAGLGGTLTTAITTPITAFMTKITEYGVARASFVQDTKLAFSTLMGSAAEASTYLNDLMTFAKKTPFTYESITSAAQNMIAVGIDSTKVLGDKMNDFKGGLLQALGDIAGATGTGATGFATYADILGKISAEGKVSQIRLDQLARSGLNLTQVLGKSTEELKAMDASALIDELTQAADTKFNGMMAGLKTTWTGAKDTFISSLKTAGLELMGAYVDNDGVTQYKFLENMTIALNKVSVAVKQLSPLLQPLFNFFESAMLKGASLIERFGNFVANAGEGTRKILGTLISALTLLGPVLFVVGKAGNSLIPVISTLSKMFGGLSGSVLGLLRFLPLIGVLAVAWATDFGGIKTIIKDGVEYMIKAFDIAKKAVNGDMNDFHKILGQLDENTFFGRFTKGLIKLKVLWKAVTEAWNTNTLSEETFQKVSELGLLPLVSAILDFKYRWDAFKEGFKKGWQDVSNAVKKSIESIGRVFKGTFIDTILTGMLNFFRAITGGDVKMWENFGKVIGTIAPILLPLVAVLAMLNKVSKPFTEGKGIIGGLLGGNKGGSSSKGGSSDSLLSNPTKTLKTMGSVAILIGGVAGIVVALGALSQIPYFNTFLSDGAQVMAKLSTAMLSVALVAGTMGLLSAGLDKLNISPKDSALGLANIAIMLGGLEVLFIAMGALTSIPSFSDFLSSGVTNMRMMAQALLPLMTLSVAMGALSLVMDKLNFNPVTALKGLANIAIMLGGLEVLIVALGAITAIPYFEDFFTSGLSNLSRISDTLFQISSLGLVAAIAGIALLGLLPVPMALFGIANLAIILAGLTLLISAFGALSMIPGFDDFISRGGDTLANLFRQVGKAVGALSEGFMTEVTSGLADVGTHLAEFANNARPFFEMASSMDFSGVSEFMLAVGALSALSVVQQFDFGESELSKLGTNLSDFAVNMQGFFDNAPTNIEQANPFTDFTINKVAPMVDSINSWDTFGENTDLGEFGTQMTNYASNMVGFFDNAPTNVSNADGLADFTINKVSDLVDAINTWDTFGENTDLGEFGIQMTNYATNMQGFFNNSPQDTGKASNLADFTIEKVPSLIEAINTWDTFGINTDLGEFGTQMTNFATNMQGFFNATAEISDMSGGTRLAEQAPNIETLVNAANSWDTFGVNTDLGEFATTLTDFANNIKGFFTASAEIGDYNGATNLANSMTSVQSIITVANGYSGSSLTTLGNDLVSFANSFSTFMNTVNGLGDVSSLNSITEALNVLASSFSTNSSTISVGAESIKNSLTNLGNSLNGMKSPITSFGTDLTTLGSTTQTAQGTVSSAFSTMASNISSSVSTIKSEISSLVSALNNADFSIPRSNIKLPHFKVTGKFDPQANTVPEYSVDWYAKGGVFDTPSLIGVGEQGAEAVMPLENNTEWIGILATQLVNKMQELTIESVQTGNMLPVNDKSVGASSGSSTVQAPIESGVSTTYDSHNTANNVTIAQGAIQVNVQNATPQEAEKFAKYVMDYIQRQTEIKRMANYMR